MHQNKASKNRLAHVWCVSIKELITDSNCLEPAACFWITQQVFQNDAASGQIRCAGRSQRQFGFNGIIQVVADVVSDVVGAVGVNVDRGMFVGEDDGVEPFVGPAKAGVGGLIVYTPTHVRFDFRVFGREARFHDGGFDEAEAVHGPVGHGEPDFGRSLCRGRTKFQWSR